MGRAEDLDRSVCELLGYIAHGIDTLGLDCLATSQQEIILTLELLLCDFHETLQ